MRERIRFVLLMLVSTALVPALASAQGSITGVVRDTTGAVLPGVTVEAASPALIEKLRAVVTDGSGQYRIIDLRPGTYAVTFTLAGFSAIKREGIELAGSFAATVNAELRVGTLQEAITVTGESPTVDVQTTTLQRVLSADTIAAIPTGRSAANLAVLVPGVQAMRSATAPNPMDVGGTTNLSNTYMAVHGSSYLDQRMTIEGATVRNVIGEGNAANFTPDMGSTQEVTIDYAAGTADQLTGGVRVNYVLREGGNSFKGSVFGTGVNSSFQADNYSQELKNRGLSEPNALKHQYDVNPSVGGPILRDRVWFYLGARWQSNASYIAGLYENLSAGNPNVYTYAPNLSQQALYFVNETNANTRLAYQINQKNKVTFFYQHFDRDWHDVRLPSSPDASTRYQFPKKRFALASWSAPLSSRLLLEARASTHADVWQTSDQSFPPGLIPVTEQGGLIPGLVYRGLDGGYRVNDQPNIHEIQSTLSYVTGSHAFKVGYSDLGAAFEIRTTDNPQSLSYRFNNGIPNQLTQRATPYTRAFNMREMGVYAQDKWTIRRLTLNAGLRFDYFDTGFPEQQLGPGTLVPSRNLTFPETAWYNFKDVTPRVGAAYDLFGDGRTAVKAHLSKYVVATNPINGHPITNLALSVNRSWNDVNGDYIPNCILENPQTNGECGTISDLSFGGIRPSTTFDPEVLAGWGKRPMNWEFSTSVQRELLPGVGLNVGYFRRWYTNFTVTDNRAVAASDFSPFSVTAPAEPRLPGGGGYVVGGFNNLNPNRVGQVDNYVTFADAFGKQIQHWNGVDVNFSARLQHGILLQGGTSTGRTSTDNCEVLVQLPEIDPVGRPYCHVDTAFLTQVKLLGTYTVPWIGVQLAGTFQSYAGPDVLANYAALNAQVQPSLGRPLSGGAANVVVPLLEPGTTYGERASQLDFRVAKVLRFGQTRSAVNLDIYNALNANTITGQNNNLAGTRWQTPQAIMNARLYKLSVQFDF